MKISRAAFFKAYTSAAVRNTLDGLCEADTFRDADLGRLRMPTALIWGENDGLFHLATARAMAAALPGARLDVLPGCAHALHIECPKALVAALQRVRRATAAKTAEEPRPALTPVKVE
jgi:pimeloyl-ACP methyl ester carboxylesterase